MSIIFETPQLLVRKLVMDDLTDFNAMQSNINVMKYTRGYAMTFEENNEELQKLIGFYDDEKPKLKVWAVVNKAENKFVGTVALIEEEPLIFEIGFRFLEKYWNKGYGTEIVNGLITFCKRKQYKKLIALVVHLNTASEKIIKNAQFVAVEKYVCTDLQLPETKYELNL